MFSNVIFFQWIYASKTGLRIYSHASGSVRLYWVTEVLCAASDNFCNFPKLTTWQAPRRSNQPVARFTKAIHELCLHAGRKWWQHHVSHMTVACTLPMAYVCVVCGQHLHSHSVIAVSFSLHFLQGFYCWPCFHACFEIELARMHVCNIQDGPISQILFTNPNESCNLQFPVLISWLGGSSSWNVRQGFMREIWSGQPVNMRYVEIL